MSLEQATKHFDSAKVSALDWFIKETASLRSGRVKPDILSSLVVEHYGTRNPLASLASVSSLDARTLLISPWDKGAITAIEKAITEANVGAMPTVDGQVIRLSFPSLTHEVREQTIRMLHKKAEEARVRLRVGRDEALKMVKKDKDDGAISEDDFYKGKEKLDQLIGKANEDIEKAAAKKEQEISSI